MKNSIYLFAILLAISVSCKNKTEKKADNTSPPSSVSASDMTTEPPSGTINTLQDFVPDGYFILDSNVPQPVQGNKVFAVLVLAPIIEKKSEEFSEGARKLLILEKVGNSYTANSSNDEVVLCKSCGGIFGDPYNGITLKNNILTISNYGGSAWRWSENYTFRFQNNEWQLIGATYDSYFNAKECKGGVGQAGRQLEDINFAVGKMQILHTQEENCEPFENYWKTFGKKKPISLANFPGTASQWPSGKLKDGDGKE